MILLEREAVALASGQRATSSSGYLAAAAVSVEGSGSGWRGRWSPLPAGQHWQIGRENDGFHGRCDGRQDRSHAGQLAALAAVSNALLAVVLVLAVRPQGLLARR